MLTATLSYTPTLVRKAVFAYVRRSFGTGGMVAFAVVVAMDAYVVAADPWSWYAGVLSGATAILAFGIACVFFLHYRQALGKLKRMGEPHAVLELTETEFRVASQSGTFAVPWSTFSDLWQFEDFWLLIIGQGQFLTLPLADLSGEVREFLLAHVGPARRRAS